MAVFLYSKSPKGQIEQHTQSHLQKILCPKCCLYLQQLIILFLSRYVKNHILDFRFSIFFFHIFTSGLCCPSFGRLIRLPTLRHIPLLLLLLLHPAVCMSLVGHSSQLHGTGAHKATGPGQTAQLAASCRGFAPPQPPGCLAKPPVVHSQMWVSRHVGTAPQTETQITIAQHPHPHPQYKGTGVFTISWSQEMKIEEGSERIKKRRNN